MNVTLLQGRLGNQLFQYAYSRAQYFNTGKKSILSEASLRIHNIENRLDCFVLSPNVEFIKNHSLTFFQRLSLSLYSRFIDSQNRSDKYAIEKKMRDLFLKSGIFVCENGFIEPPKEKRRNILNIGYFQSEAYFESYKNLILEELQFKDCIKNSVKDLAERIISSVEPTCLHIRLGDYVKNPLHGLLDASYYRRAISKLRKLKPNATLFLFSDNVELVKQELGLDDVFYIPAEIDEQQTMYLGSLCHNFVISNSSFSWWMQYLSRKEERLVIAPSRWYAQPCPCDIYQKSWVLIDA